MELFIEGDSALIFRDSKQWMNLVMNASTLQYLQYSVFMNNSRDNYLHLSSSYFLIPTQRSVHLKNFLLFESDSQLKNTDQQIIKQKTYKYYQYCLQMYSENFNTLDINNNTYLSSTIMKLSLIAISVLIALQATSLFVSPQERYNYHNSIYQIYHLVTGSQQMNNCFKCDEEIRIVLVTFMYSAAYLLLMMEIVWPAFLCQLCWILLQSNILINHDLNNVYKVTVQLLILYILFSNIQCCYCSSQCSPKSVSCPIENTNSAVSAQKKHKEIEQKQEFVEPQQDSHKNKAGSHGKKKK